MTRFDTVLVANRGEIALRVIRAAAACGLRSVAVYSDADRDAPHVRAADRAVAIGPAAARDSYLSIPALLHAAAETGAGAIHPGYGFLSERAAFARAATQAGIVFVGPSAEVMEVMGRKDRARAVAVAAGVPVVPAWESAGADSADVDLASIGAELGFPLLVKAAAGGGGKGMRIVSGLTDLAEAVDSARREALSAFGDDTMLYERYVERGRHVEVQVLADEQGHVVHLFERDCSVQRRHQKVLEEAPATTISPTVRDTLLTSAVALTRQVGYTNAGTVEFLVSGDDTYFLEMNTRLQVEHPVTELLTGVDLVALQFAIAQGESLPFTQEQVRAHGHAIEARVYAEDPFHGFLPQAGVVRRVHWPSQARVDAALEDGQRVGTSYDPMLGKVIVSGATREAARMALVDALDETAILGLATNVGFLRSVVASDAYRDATIDTAWLDRNPGWIVPDTPDEAWWIAAQAVARVSGGAGDGPFGGASGWRLGGDPAGIPISLTGAPPNPGEAGVSVSRLFVVHHESGLVDEAGRSVSVRRAQPSSAVAGLDRYEIGGSMYRAAVDVDTHTVSVAYRGQTHVFQLPDAFGPAQHLEVVDGSVLAPMPGTVLAVLAQVGQEVAEGESLGVMEAMKMELALRAPVAGIVAEVQVSVGALVDVGATLFVVEPADRAEPVVAQARA